MQPDTSSENNVLTKWRCPAPKLAIKTLTFSMLYYMGPRSSHSVVLISTRMAIARCTDDTDVWLQIAHDHIRRVMLFPVTPTMKATTSCYCIFQCFFSKKITRKKIDQKSLLQTAISIFLIGSYCLTKLDCYNLLLHDVTGDQGLAFCSGNSDRDGKVLIPKKHFTTKWYLGERMGKVLIKNYLCYKMSGTTTLLLLC